MSSLNEKRRFFGFGKNVFFTGLVSFFMDVSSEMIYPLVPLFLSGVLGVNKSFIGLIEGIAESTASLVKILSGWFSDRVGRRKDFMVVGYGISVLSRPIIATASSWHHVLAARFGDRLGKGIRTAPRDALIDESAEKTHLAQAFGFHRSMDTMGAVIGPGAAIFILWLFNNDFHMVFWLSMIPGTIAVLLILLFIQEKSRMAPYPHSLHPKLTLKHFNWRMRFFIAIVIIFALGNSSDVFLILRAQQIGVPTGTIPAVYLMFNLVYSLSAIPAGIAADRFGRKKVILLGFVLFSVLYYGFAVVESTTGIWILFGSYGIFMGLTEGVQKAFLAVICPPDFKATAFGVYAAAMGLATLPASVIGGLLWDRISPAATFYFGATAAAISALLFVVMILAEKISLREVLSE